MSKIDLINLGLNATDLYLSHKHDIHRLFKKSRSDEEEGELINDPKMLLYTMLSEMNANTSSIRSLEDQVKAVRESLSLTNKVLTKWDILELDKLIAAKFGVSIFNPEYIKETPELVELDLESVDLGNFADFTSLVFIEDTSIRRTSDAFKAPNTYVDITDDDGNILLRGELYVRRKSQEYLGDAVGLYYPGSQVSEIHYYVVEGNLQLVDRIEIYTKKGVVVLPGSVPGGAFKSTFNMTVEALVECFRRNLERGTLYIDSAIANKYYLSDQPKVGFFKAEELQHHVKIYDSTGDFRFLEKKENDYFDAIPSLGIPVGLPQGVRVFCLKRHARGYKVDRIANRTRVKNMIEDACDLALVEIDRSEINKEGALNGQ